jgi:hypothetical protein
MAIGILVEYPILAAAVGILLLGLGRRKHQWTAMAVGVISLLYAAYEAGMQQRWLCSGECNIRIDLLVIYPTLLISLVVAGVSLLRRQREPRPPA